jgi:hypothetical protein
MTASSAMKQTKLTLTRESVRRLTVNTAIRAGFSIIIPPPPGAPPSQSKVPEGGLCGGQGPEGIV